MAKKRPQPRKRTAMGATPKPSQSEEDWKYKVRDAASTLIRAEEISRDPKLHAAALKELERIAAEAKKVIARNQRGTALMRKKP